MRSRFSAYATGDAEYLWHTLHPDHEERAHPRDEVTRAIKAASRTLKYMRLKILEARDERVLFLAEVFERGANRSFVELSTFARDGGAWRYLAGECRDARGGEGVERVSALTIASFVGDGSARRDSGSPKPDGCP
jgi:SEC-C motif-containing protein